MSENNQKQDLKLINENSLDDTIENEFNKLILEKKWMDNEDFKSVYKKVEELAKQDKTKMTSFMKNVLALHERGENVTDLIKNAKKKYDGEEYLDNVSELVYADIATIMSFNVFENPIGKLKDVKPENQKLVLATLLSDAIKFYGNKIASNSKLVEPGFYSLNPKLVFIPVFSPVCPFFRDNGNPDLNLVILVVTMMMMM